MYDWDMEKFFSSTGGATAMIRLLEKHGLPAPDLRTVYMWRSRRRISHAWLPTLMVVLLAEGVPLRDLLVRRGVWAAAAAPNATGGSSQSTSCRSMR